MKANDVVYDDGMQRLTVGDVSRGFARAQQEMSRAAATSLEAMRKLGDVIQAIDAAGMSLDDVAELEGVAE